MKNIDKVLCDFYNLFNISISFVDDKLQIINEKGYSKELFEFLDNINIYEKINVNNFNTINLTYFESIHFIIIKLHKKNNNGHFIVGPFKSKNNTYSIDIPLKPIYCIDCISSSLQNIINKNLIENKFNTYVKESIDFIHKNYSNDIKIDDVCKTLNINKSYFCSIFKKDTGYTFTNFLNRVRIEKSKEFLRNNDMSILNISLSVGFNNHNYYTSLFKKINNITPIDYKKRFIN